MIIFILPSMRGVPPRGMLIDADEDQLKEDGIVEAETIQVIFSQDLGMWIDPSGRALPEELGEALTERAKELGVPWD